MSDANPYALLRNTATLQAYRSRQRAAWRTARPFFLIYGLTMAAMVGVLVFGLWPAMFQAGHRGRIAQTLPLFLIPMALGAVALALGRARIARYLRDHPLDLGRL